MTRTLAVILCALALLAAPLLAAKTPTRHEALVAIEVLEKAVSGPKASEAARTVMAYAQDSDDVMVDIGPPQLPWMDEKWGLEKGRELEFQSLLLASFVAGNIRSQIKNDQAEDDTYSGWLFAIKTYQRLRAIERFDSPALDELARQQAEGTLLERARGLQHPDGRPDEAAEAKKPFA
jgi:hypothetical protein